MPYIGKSPSAGVRQRYQYTATASQTTFSGTDLGNLTLTYTDNNFVDVFQNGVLLKGGGTDYTATSGTSVVLTTGASVSDVIEIIVYDVFSVGNFFNRTDSDSRYVNHNSNTAGTDNFIAGNNAGDAIQSGGNYNTVIGNEAGTAITTGDRNTAVGFEALKTATTAQYNVAVGYQALENNTGNNNTAVGDQALEANTSGTNNTAVGDDALVANTTGIRNAAVGNNALAANQQGDQSVAVGFNALQAQNPSGNADMNNTAVGNDAGYANTTGSGNTFIGSGAGDSLTTGINSTFVGYLAGSGVSTGNNNTMMGQAAGQNTTGSFNNFFGGGNGTAAGYDVTSGSKNTILGGFSGNQGGLDIRTTDNNIVFSDGDGNPRGYYYGGLSSPLWIFSTPTGNQNSMQIINSASSNPYGIAILFSNNNPDDSSRYFISCSGSGNVKFIVYSNGSVLNGTGSYGQISDEKLKENIVDANSQWDDIKAVKVKNFSFKADKLDKPNMLGVVAQDLEASGMSGLVENHEDIDEDTKESLGTTTKSVKYSILYMKAVKALQEAMTRIEALETKNDALEARIKKLEDG